MGYFAVKYTNEQREALGAAYEDLGIRPAARVVAMAKAGRLTCDGKTLEPFDAHEDTVRDLARKLRQRRAGTVKSKLEQEGPRDSVEQIRVRMLRIIDAELTIEERRKRGTRDLERIRGLVRAARELAAMPAPNEPRPVKPGDKHPEDNKRHDGATRGGLGASILRAATKAERVQTRAPKAAQDVQTRNTKTETNGARSEAQHASTNEHDDTRAGAPGSWAEGEGARLLGAASSAE